MTTVGYVRANEAYGRTAGLPARNVDLLFCVGSWEQRSLAISSWNKLSADRTIILRFRSRKDDSVKDANIQKLKDDLKDRSKCSVLDLPSTTEMPRAFDVIRTALSDTSERLGRKVRVCIDISTMPRSLIAFMLLMSFRTKLVDEITIFFAVSDHSETLKLIAGEGDSARSPLVEGNWKLMSIPYGEGIVKGSRYDQIVVSVGLDTYQIIDVIDRIEPWASIFLTPHRGDGLDMDKLAEERFRKILNRYSAEFDSGRFQRLSVHPYQLGWMSQLSALMKLVFLRQDASTLFYPFGPKIHSVGLSLLALHDERIAVIGRTPTSYFQRPVEATQLGHIIELVDLSSTTSIRGTALAS